MLKIAAFAQRSASIKEKVKDLLATINEDQYYCEEKPGKIKLVFAGQYSAGKSSILKMLTNRDDIEIGAGITTQEAHSYDWNGIEVIDTPGIHTELRPDHDMISYEAIASADMLVFVITNELFDSYMADHFRKLAIDKDKAGEMILVVNKMDRTAEGNTKEQQDIIRDDLKKVLEPYTPEQVNLTFLDAESYLDSVEEREEDPELADELASRSGYKQFIDTLNRFIAEKGVTSKLTTELYVIDNQLEKAIEGMQPKSSDADVDALEESYIQQRHLLIEARGRMQQEIRDIFTVASSEIRDIGLNAADLLIEGCRKDDVEEELERSIKKVQDITENSQNEAKEILETRLIEMGRQLEIIENTEFSQNLKSRLTGKFDGLPDNIKNIIYKVSPELKRAGQKVLDNAYKQGTHSGLKLTNFSESNIHQIVVDAGHKLGYKFKPWQAAKITKGIAIGAEALNILGVGLNIFMQVKEDQDEEKIRADLKKNRQNVRSQFNAAANDLEDFSRKFINDNIKCPLDISIADLEENIEEIRKTRLNRSIKCRQLEELQVECRLLIQDIHTEYEEM